MSEAAPAFSFYAKDFMFGTINMSLAARGAYITLLAYQWDHGSVPGDLAEVARICGCSPRQLEAVWTAVIAKFQRGTDGLWRNARLEGERLKQAERRAALAANGQKGGRPRKTKPKATGNQQVSSSFPKSKANENQTESLPSPFPLPSPSSFPVPKSSSSKRPIFVGQRFTVFEFQLDQLARLLGPHLEAFDLHAWFFDLDEQVRRSEAVIPQRDNGAWLLAQTEAEALRRGLRLAATSTSKRLIETTVAEDAAAVLALLQKERGA